MPTATLKFTLPDEEIEFRSAMDGANWQIVAWNVDQYLRGQIKYAGDETPSEVLEALEKARETLRDQMMSHGLAFE
jgi:hypothetical protein